MSTDPEKPPPANAPTTPTTSTDPSTTTTTPTPSTSPSTSLPPWTQILSSHLCTFSTFGPINSFAIYQSLYTSPTSPLPPTTPSTISWIGTVQILLIYALGPLSGRLHDAGHLRPTLLAGHCFLLAGIFGLSFAREYWHAFLAQGLCQGIGMGLIFTPGVANAARWCEPRWRVLGVSAVACGGATGGMVFPAVARSLLPRVGFGWTVRVMGFVVVATGGVVGGLARTRVVRGARGGAWVEWGAFGEPEYALYCASMFFAFWGIWIAYYYVRAYAREMLDFSDMDSFNLILIINGVGVPGRLLPALIADRFFGPVNVFIPVIFLAGVCLFCWAAVTTSAGMIAFVVFYGFFGAGTQSLLQAALASLNTDPKKAGVRIGMGFSVVGLASLTGSPIGGALLEKKDGQYLYAQIFAGGTMIVGSLVLVAARISKTGFVLRARM